MNAMNTGTQPESSGIELETVTQGAQSAMIRKGFCHLPVTLCVSSAPERVIRLEFERVFRYLSVILSIYVCIFFFVRIIQVYRSWSTATIQWSISFIVSNDSWPSRVLFLSKYHFLLRAFDFVRNILFCFLTVAVYFVNEKPRI